MRKSLLALLLFVPGPATLVAQAPAIVYAGGRVWTGTGFAVQTLAVRAGRFIDLAEAGDNARRVDLTGRFVVPAYANAHTHLTNASDNANAAFLTAGVFYAWNPTNIVLPDSARRFFARADTYDVALSNGAITEPGGHPERLYVDILQPRVYPNRSRESFLGDAFHYGRTPQEIDAALDLLVAQRADFVKAMLLHTEEYERRRDEDAFHGLRGINPANARHLVTAAKARGLQVAFHIETRADLLVAAEAGASMVAHLPGYHAVETAQDLVPMMVTPDVARAVAAADMRLVPTYSLLVRGSDEGVDPVLAQLHRAMHAENLRLLDQAGGTILTGTDQAGEIFAEAEYLASLGTFAPARLLEIVLETGAHLFPDRRIGCFAAGCEADFLVLREDPLQDIRALRAIERRVKAGHPVGG